MKKYLIVDVESTGLPVSYDAPFTDTDNWPRVIELSWELCWENGDTIEKACDLIYPDDFKFPVGEFWEKNGFNEVESLLNGVDPIIAFTNLAMAMNCADVLVAHNLSYDLPIIECEFYRYKLYPKAIYRRTVELGLDIKAGLRPEGVKLQKECTKLLSTPIVKLPGIYGNYSWPKLEVAYEFAFGEKMTGAHHASSDVEATKRLYLWIKSLEDIL